MKDVLRTAEAVLQPVPAWLREQTLRALADQADAVQGEADVQLQARFRFPMTAAIYKRVSTDRQDREGTGRWPGQKHRPEVQLRVKWETTLSGNKSYSHERPRR